MLTDRLTDLRVAHERLRVEQLPVEPTVSIRGRIDEARRAILRAIGALEMALDEVSEIEQEQVRR